MKDKFKSPCIIKDTTNTVLIMNDGFGYHLHGAFQGEISDEEYYIDSDCKNITREYLANTYGEVVSPEHAEFIIELAKNEGLWVYVDSPKINRAFFTFNESSGLFFYDSEEDINKGRCKKITIPLPPKADRKESNEWVPDFSDLPKHFDCVCNKCGGKCCTGQCYKQESSEWPQIGDEVCWGSGHAGVVKSLSDEFAWVKRSDNSQYVTLYVSSLEKPKTPEEELREKIGAALCSFVDSEKPASEHIDEIINIFKKPQ